MTLTEMARMGGRARAERHSKAEIRRWGKQGGRPARLEPRALSRLARMLAQGKSQAECAAEVGVSTRTVGRAVARMRLTSDADAIPAQNRGAGRVRNPDSLRLGLSGITLGARAEVALGVGL